MNWIDILVTPLLAALVGFAVWYLQSRIATIRREQSVSTMIGARSTQIF